MKPIKTTVDNQFLKKLVKEQLLEQKKEEEENDWWGSAVNTVKQTFHSVKRWSNKKLYDNNREQAVANIESSDPDIEKIKDFFTLYSEVCYEGSIYASAFKSAWAIEDPGIYCLQDDTKNKLDSWRADNKTKFLKEMMEAEKENESAEDIMKIIEEYVDDFCSTFDFYGLRIEAGSRRLTVSTGQGMNLVKACVKVNPGLLKDWRSQWHGSKICIIDTFPHLFKFIWDLNTGKQSIKKVGGSTIDDLEIFEQLEAEKQPKVFPEPVGSDYPDVSEVFASANVVRSTQKYSTAIEMQKKSNFVRKLRADSGLKKKWTGFCYNMTFDPYGEHDLQYWTTDAQALKTKSEKTTADQYLEVARSVIGWVAIDRVTTYTIAKSIQAIQAARAAMAVTSIGAQAAAGGATAVETGGVSILVTVVSIGVTCLIAFDPFEWFSVRDDIEDEYQEILENLIILNKLISSGNPRTSSAGREKLIKIQNNISNSFSTIVRLLHEAMESGLQADIGNIKTQMDVKKNLLGNIASSIQTAKQQLKALDFTKNNMDAGEISRLITFCRETIKQLKNIGAEEAKWDNKIKRDTNLGKDIQSIEAVNENILLEQSSSVFSDSQVKKIATIIKQRYGMDILSVKDEEDAMSYLQRARDINVNFSSKKQKSLKEKYRNSFDYLDDSDPGNLNSQASAFADWWSDNFAQEQPEETSTKTIYNSAWVQSALGLKSSTYYSKNSLTRDGIGDSLEAFCGIGLSHALGNTSFYYTQDFGKIIGATGANVREKFLSKSEIKMQNGAPVVINKKPYIQSLRAIIRDIDSAGQREEIKQVVSKLSSAIGSESDKVESMKLKTLNLMVKVYYNFELDGIKLAESLLAADDKLTQKMLSLSSELTVLSPDKQNTAEHARILSELRQTGGWKIMLFQAIMNIG